MRDIEKEPYTKDEERVAKFLCDCGIGGGDDPVGFLIASCQVLVAERNALRQEFEEYKMRIRTERREGR